MKLRAALVIAVLISAAACGEPERRGGLSPDEERQLDNAAKMLDDNMVIDTSGGPAANGQ